MIKWLYAYIDILMRLKLYKAAAEIISYDRREIHGI